MHNIIVLGIIISIIYYEITEISPGGVIVPGYIALYLNQPDRIISTIILSLLTLLVVNILAEHVIIYGKRRFGISVITSLILKAGIEKTLAYLSLPLIFATSPIGFIIAGLIAQDIHKQGSVKTISSMLLVATLVKLADMVLSGGFV